MSERRRRYVTGLSRLVVSSSTVVLLLSTTALSQTFDGSFTRVGGNGSVQTGVSITSIPGNAANAGGYELMTGTATIDAAGGSFTNFDTVGSEGSGGGAGLGGVFFVNTGASLTIKDANFIGNTAKGGEGGGGGSVGLSDAGFSVADKKAVGTSNFIAGFDSKVSGTATGGGFFIDEITFWRCS